MKAVLTVQRIHDTGEKISKKSVLNTKLVCSESYNHCQWSTIISGSTMNKWKLYSNHEKCHFKMLFIAIVFI